jgi:hypothetical protein
MITGNGSLALRDGRRLDVGYQFSSDHDDQRAGYLLCEISEVDRTAFYQRPLLTCDDGTIVVIAVMQSSGRHHGVIGRVLAAAETA